MNKEVTERRGRNHHGEGLPPLRFPWGACFPSTHNQLRGEFLPPQKSYPEGQEGVAPYLFIYG